MNDTYTMQNRNAYWIFIALLTGLIAANACKHETITPTPPTDKTGTPCNNDTVYFHNQVLPLLVSQCAMSDCHNKQFHTVNIDLTDYPNVLKLVSKYHAEGSVLYTIVTASDPSDRMPVFPLPSWTPAQADLIKTWINQGALDNQCNEQYGACDTTHITYANFVQPLIANQCQGCHIQNDWGGGITLNSYDEVKNTIQNGRFNGALAWQAGFSPMPKFGKKLPDCFLQKIDAWIKAGFPQ